MTNYEIGLTVKHILSSYQHHVVNDLEAAIEDIGKCFAQVQDEEAKKGFFTDFLWSLRGEGYVKPPRSPSNPRPAFDLIIRSWARFGPANHLPAYLFSMLGFEKEPHDFWEREILPSFRDALQRDSGKFRDETLKAIEQTMRTTGREPDGTLRATFETLGRIASQILYGRFRNTLHLGQTPANATAPKNNLGVSADAGKAKDELAGLIKSVGLDSKLSAAIRKCREYLESKDAFEAKAAGDLLRSAIDEVNRSLVWELVQITGQQFNQEDKDELRRQYFVSVAFISEHEKKFFTAIYSLISNESTHQLDAPKETMLVLERTVTDYLILMLRRLLERKGGNLLPMSSLESHAPFERKHE